jgi:hypothetical protein
MAEHVRNHAGSNQQLSASSYKGHGPTTRGCGAGRCNHQKLIHAADDRSLTVSIAVRIFMKFFWSGFISSPD